MYYIKPQRKIRYVRIRVLAILIIVGILAVLVDMMIEYMIRDTAISMSRRIASGIVNDAVVDVLENGDFKYNDFIDIVSNESGAVQSVSAKSDYVNRFKSEIGRAVIEALENDVSTEINIPLGTLTDIGILYGRGPDVKIRLTLYGDMTTSLESTFVSVGINQTKHSIICIVSANIAIITPSFTTYTCVESEYMVAETVIVGAIPDSYTDVNGDDSGIIGQIFDYADVE